MLTFFKLCLNFILCCFICLHKIFRKFNIKIKYKHFGFMLTFFKLCLNIILCCFIYLHKILRKFNIKIKYKHFLVLCLTFFKLCLNIILCCFICLHKILRKFHLKPNLKPFLLLAAINLLLQILLKFVQHQLVFVLLNFQALFLNSLCFLK